MSVISNHLLTAEFYPHINPSMGVTRDPVTTTGPARRGAGFYSGRGGLHTVQYSVTNFIGTITIQSTICLHPAETDWFTVETIDFPDRIFHRDTEVLTGVRNFVGKYTFIRASITYTFGSVSSIMLNHQ